MDRALEHGINFFDTANVYGRKSGEGVTEQIIGRWLAQGGDRRDKIVLATKVYGEMGEWPNQSRLSARCTSAAPATTACAACRPTTSTCTRCTTSTAPPPGTRSGRRWSCWSQQGKVIYVGSSNFAGWHIAQACESARQRHFLGLVSEQSIYSLLERTDRAGGDPRLPRLRPGPASPGARSARAPWPGPSAVAPSGSRRRGETAASVAR